MEKPPVESGSNPLPTSPAQEIGIRGCEAGAQRYLGAPAKRGELGDVKQFLRSAVRLRRVELELAAIADDIGDQASKVTDADVLAGPDVEKAMIRVMLHHEHAGIRQIVDRKKFAPRRAGPPDHDVGSAAGLCLMKATNESCRHVAVQRMIIVAWPVQV